MIYQEMKVYKCIALCMVWGASLTSSLTVTREGGAASLRPAAPGGRFGNEPSQQAEASGIEVKRKLPSLESAHSGTSAGLQLGSMPWALRWWARSRAGSSQGLALATVRAPETMSFEVQTAPKSFEWALVSLLSITVLAMFVAAVLCTARASASALAWDAKMQQQPEGAVGFKHMYQGEDENLNEELLERAWWAEELARLQMAKFMEEVAKQKDDLPADPPSVSSLASSEDDQWEPCMATAAAQSELPFALLMGDERAPASGLPSPWPAKPCVPLPAADLDDQLIAKNSIAKKLRHPRAERRNSFSNGPNPSLTRPKLDPSRYKTS